MKETPTMKTIDTLFSLVEDGLRGEEQRVFMSGLAAIRERNAAQDQIKSHLAHILPLAQQNHLQLEVALRFYTCLLRLQQLPFLPPSTLITRIHNLLRLQPRILVIDDTIEHEEPEIERVLVMESDGTILFNQAFIAPLQPSEVSLSQNGEHASSYTAPSEIQDTPMWSELLDVISGHYVLAFDLAFAQLQLESTARRFHLTVPVLIGRELCLRYLGKVSAPHVGADEEEIQALPAVLYSELWIPSSEHGSYSIEERATNALHTLQDMAQGAFFVNEP